MAARKTAPKRKTTAGKSTPLQAVNKRIRIAKADLKAGKKGASQKLDKAITAKAKLYEKKGRASCKR